MIGVLLEGGLNELHLEFVWSDHCLQLQGLYNKKNGSSDVFQISS
jgi:hypothetical protein